MMQAKTISFILAVLCLGDLAFTLGFHIATDNTTQKQYNYLIASYLTMVIAYSLMAVRAHRRGRFGFRYIYWMAIMLAAPIWYTIMSQLDGWSAWALAGIAGGAIAYGAYAEWKA